MTCYHSEKYENKSFSIFGNSSDGTYKKHSFFGRSYSLEKFSDTNGTIIKEFNIAPNHSIAVSYSKKERANNPNNFSALRILKTLRGEYKTTVYCKANSPKKENFPKTVTLGRHNISDDGPYAMRFMAKGSDNKDYRLRISCASFGDYFSNDIKLNYGSTHIGAIVTLGKRLNPSCNPAWQFMERIVNGEKLLVSWNKKLSIVAQKLNYEWL